MFPLGEKGRKHGDVHVCFKTHLWHLVIKTCALVIQIEMLTVFLYTLKLGIMNLQDVVKCSIGN